jgi:hypothetical protein
VFPLKRSQVEIQRGVGYVYLRRLYESNRLAEYVYLCRIYESNRWANPGLVMTLKIDYYYYERYLYHLANLKYSNFSQTINCYFLHIILLDILCKI